ncbi:hypothetical protein CEXT_334831 [Caerostris extrusa]|uniref:Uncharacterized protein n=1 Tax=Caerostris extrusa TaxID=172846 RepID=A0AAV4UZR1_CAEEX|nr:hypothetical protein CEXT_334831 [Caerostris extrusa]
MLQLIIIIIPQSETETWPSFFVKNSHSGLVRSRNEFKRSSAATQFNSSFPKRMKSSRPRTIQLLPAARSVFRHIPLPKEWEKGGIKRDEIFLNLKLPIN